MSPDRIRTISPAHVGDLRRGDMVRGIYDRKIVTGCPVSVIRVRDLPNGRRRVSYLIPGSPFAYGWRDLATDHGVTVERWT